MRAVCKRKNDAMLVSLSGELDHHGAAKIVDKLKACAEDKAVKKLVVDMSNVTFMDSSGIGALLGRYRTMAEKKGQMVLKNPSDQIYKLLRMAGMAKLVEKN
ncbi:MAG: STAS domain-containing protein [Christensenellales bacterium]|jgi:stage II sporulation protein AA (anti-sigma F factor antagonist)